MTDETSKTEEFSKRELEEARRFFAGQCDFVLGVAALEQLPSSDRVEIAFAGRSNVGKSSLLNALTGRKSLARTSHTPGRTQQLNFFNLGGRMYLVDMPGYGYAKVSKGVRAQWNKLISSYLQGRPNLRCVFVLVDSRRGLMDSDLELMDMLDKAAVSYRIILTKCDKLKAADKKARLEEIGQVLLKHPCAFPDVLCTSAHKDDNIGLLRAILCAFR